MSGAERILFVCTANLCRSPMAQAFLRHELKSAEVEVEVLSAGFLTPGQPADKKVVWAMRRLGFDLSGHFSTKASNALDSGPDLVLTMARAHLRTLMKLDPALLSRAFTLKEFVHLAHLEGPRKAGEPLSHYLARLGRSRSVSALTSPGTEMDVPDPIGGPKRSFLKCASELQGLVRECAVTLYSWPNRTQSV